MGVDAHVPRCATKTLSFSVRDVLFWLGITVLLGHSKVHNVYDLLKRHRLDMERSSNYEQTIWAFSPWTAYKEVVRFDISVNEVLFVNRLGTSKLEEERRE